MIDFDLKAYELGGDIPGAGVDILCLKCDADGDPFWLRPRWDEVNGYDYTIAGFIELARQHDEEFHS